MYPPKTRFGNAAVKKYAAGGNQAVDPTGSRGCGAESGWGEHVLLYPKKQLSEFT
jgi:hypothetical protein